MTVIKMLSLQLRNLYKSHVVTYFAHRSSEDIIIRNRRNDIVVLSKPARHDTTLIASTIFKRPSGIGVNEQLTTICLSHPNSLDQIEEMINKL